MIRATRSHPSINTVPQPLVGLIPPITWLLLIATGTCGVSANDETAQRESRRPIRVKRDLPFCETAGETLTADIYRPADDLVYPLVMMIHGGAWSSGDKWNLQDHARELAQAGFVAVAINYRLAPKHRYPAQIDDCREALRWMVSTADQWKADKERFGVWGYSAGGHLALLLACDQQVDAAFIDAVVAGGAPCEFSFLSADSRLLAAVMGGTPAESPDLYRLASPIHYVSEDGCPNFLYHGTADLFVPASSSRKMHQRCVEMGVHSEYLSVVGKGHLLTFVDFEARRRAVEFLQKQLSTSK